MKNVISLTGIVGALLSVLIFAAAVNAQDAGGQYMPQYSSTTATYYGGSAPPASDPSFAQTQVQAPGQMSPYQMQEQALANSRAFDRSTPADFAPPPPLQQQTTPVQSTTQQFGKVAKSARVRGAVSMAGHIAARTAAVALPVTGMALIARSMSQSGSMVPIGSLGGLGRLGALNALRRPYYPGYSPYGYYPNGGIQPYGYQPMMGSPMTTGFSNPANTAAAGMMMMGAGSILNGFHL